jgi:hypothetical protein
MKRLVATAGFVAFVIVFFVTAIAVIKSRSGAVATAKELAQSLPVKMDYESTRFRMLSSHPFFAWVSEFSAEYQLSGPPTKVHVDLFGNAFDPRVWTDFFEIRRRLELQRIEQNAAGQPATRPLSE